MSVTTTDGTVKVHSVGDRLGVGGLCDVYVGEVISENDEKLKVCKDKPTVHHPLLMLMIRTVSRLQ